jgi:hypothetical protein
MHLAIFLFFSTPKGTEIKQRSVVVVVGFLLLHLLSATSLLRFTRWHEGRICMR